MLTGRKSIIDFFPIRKNVKQTLNIKNLYVLCFFP